MRFPIFMRRVSNLSKFRSLRWLPSEALAIDLSTYRIRQSKLVLTKLSDNITISVMIRWESNTAA